MKQIVCESMRVIERRRQGDEGEEEEGGGSELNCIWQGKKGGRERGRECFHLPLLEKHLILG